MTTWLSDAHNVLPADDPITTVVENVALGRRVYYSTRTVNDAIDARDQVLRRPDLGDLIDKVVRVRGQESISFKNGGHVVFRSRHRYAAGRGYSADVLILDEAQTVTERHLEDLVPMLAACPDPRMYVRTT